MCAIPGVALQARFIGLRSRQPRRIDDVLGFQTLNMLCAVAVAAFARRGSRILQEFGAFAVNVLGEGLRNLNVTFLAFRSNHGRLISSLPGRLRLGSGPAGARNTKERPMKDVTIDRATARLTG
jgi:hypothetical protein